MMVSIQTKETFVKICKSCNEKMIKSHFLSDRCRICNICKLKRKQSFKYNEFVYNLNTSKLLGKKGLVTFEFISGKKKVFSLKNAIAFVKEGRAAVKNYDTINELFDTDTLHFLVLYRESEICQCCKKTGDFVEMIVPKERGGKETLLNMHCICGECKKTLKGINKVVNLPQPPSRLNLSYHQDYRPTKHRSCDRGLQIYCDCSIYNPELYGLGLVFVKNHEVKTIAEVVKVNHQASSIFGEMLAICIALNTLIDPAKRTEFRWLHTIVILSDIAAIEQFINQPPNKTIYVNMAHKIRELLLLVSVLYPKTIVKIRYIGEIRNNHYKLAHKTARTWIKSIEPQHIQLYEYM